MKKRRGHPHHQQQEQPFAGLRAEKGAAAPNDSGALVVCGVAAAPLDDAGAAAFATGAAHLVPCGAGAAAADVDRFDGRLLLDDVARWAGGQQQQQQQQRWRESSHDAGSDGEDAALEADLERERYRFLDPSKEHLLRSGLPFPAGAGAADSSWGEEEDAEDGDGNDDGGCASSVRRARSNTRS
jgi:hypothetical protein